MRLSIFFTWVGFLLTSTLVSQVKLDLVLQNKLKESNFSEKEQNFIVKGDIETISLWLSENSGKIKYISKEGLGIRVKASKINELAAFPNVNHIYFNNYKGTILNDRGDSERQCSRFTNRLGI